MQKSNAFRQLLNARITAANTLVCVGLDPVVERLPQGIPHTADGVADFCIELVRATADIAACFKPNLPFYLSLGDDGARALRRVRESIPADIPMVLDCKVNDIGETAHAWARMAFGYFETDAVVVNPYMGEDTVAPHMEYADKGVIVLVKTSNAGSGDFQDLQLANGETMYRHVAAQTRDWHNRYPADIGMVVGATYPDQLAAVREMCPDQIVLLPGLGAQGGDVEASVRAGVDANGAALLCSSSRGIMYASNGTDFAEAARNEAIRLRDDINRYRHAPNIRRQA